MKIEITHGEIPQKNLITKISLVLVGILAVTTIFAFSMQLFEEAGIWLGLILSAFLVFLGFSYTQKGTKLRLVTWSISISLAIILIIFLVGINIILNALEGF